MSPNFTSKGSRLIRLLLFALTLWPMVAQAQNTSPAPVITLTPLAGSFTNGVNLSRVQINLTGGSGQKSLVVIRLGTTGRVGPTDLVTYTAPNVTPVPFGTNPTTSTTSTGNGNFVVLAAAPPTNAVTVSGLIDGTEYSVDAYAYNEGSSGPVYFPQVRTETFIARPTYEWLGIVPSNGGDRAPSWSTPGNWTPSRQTPSNEDVLVFSGLETTVDFDVNETINQLIVANRASVSLRSGINNPGLTFREMPGEPGADMRVDNNTTLSLQTLNDNRSILFTLPTNETGAIAGTLSFGNPKTGSGGGAGVTSSHRLLKTGLGQIVVQRGGQITFEDRNQGNVFENSAAGSVFFTGGSAFDQNGGITQPPFGSTTAPIAIFAEASIYRLRFVSAFSSGGSFDPSGRTFGNLEFINEVANASPYTITYTQPVTIQNDLITMPGRLGTITVTVIPTSILLSASSDISIAGNITVDVQSSLTFGRAAGNPLVTLDGASTQFISGTGSLNFDDAVRLVIRNTDPNNNSVVLRRPVTVGRLTLERGIVTTLPIVNVSANNLLTVVRDVPTAANPDDTRLVVSANNTTGGIFSFINGPFGRIITGSTSLATSFFYPIGVRGASGPIYRPVTLAANSLTASTIAAPVPYTAQQFEGTPPALTLGPNLARVSRIRYYELASTGTLSNGFITLRYEADDEVNNVSRLRVAKSEGTQYISIGPTPPDAPGNMQNFLVGNITSTVPFSTLGIFTLGSSVLESNPLPVELVAFTAQRQGGGALLQWRTATEKNNAYFEVERSADGRQYRPLGRVAGAGNSTAPRNYRFEDAQLLVGTTYYRLRQVDHDGATAYSNVVTLTGMEAAGITVYPNPATTELNVSVDDAVGSWRIVNSLGKIVREGNASLQRLDVSGLKAGTYLLEVNLKNAGRTTHRFVKN